jgi:hypothetical protein
LLDYKEEKPMSELLESRWQDTKTALLEGLSGNQKAVMASTLENTRKYLSETATAGATSAGNIATLNRVILPVIRRVMPTVIANEIVGVQPMTGPVGQIHTLRVRYSDSFTGASGGSTTAGEEALSPFKIAEGYSAMMYASRLAIVRFWRLMILPMPLPAGRLAACNRHCKKHGMKMPMR